MDSIVTQFEKLIAAAAAHPATDFHVVVSTRPGTGKDQ